MSCSSLGWLLARQVSQVKSKRDLLSPFRTRNLNGTERAEATTLRYRSLALGMIHNRNKYQTLAQHVQSPRRYFGGCALPP